MALRWKVPALIVALLATVVSAPAVLAAIPNPLGFGCNSSLNGGNNSTTYGFAAIGDTMTLRAGASVGTGVCNFVSVTNPQMWDTDLSAIVVGTEIQGTTLTLVASAGAGVYSKISVTDAVGNPYYWNISVTVEPSAPHTPTSVMATGTSIAVTVPATVAPGVPAVTTVVTATPGSSTCTILRPAIACTVSGLTAGETYSFKAKAAAGYTPYTAESAASNSVTLPAAPVVPSAPASPAAPLPATCTMDFSANGGSGAPAALSITCGDWGAAPSGSSMTRPGFTFDGWNTNSAGGGLAFAPGASFRLDGSNSLYAIWKATDAAQAGPAAATPSGLSTEPPASSPASLLSAGETSYLVAGQPVPVTVRPNQANDPFGLVITGPDITMRLEGRGDDSDPLGLTSKQALILQSEVVQRSLRSRSATVQPVAKSSGEGFKADSSVRLYILPNTYLGTLTTNGSGAYAGSVPVPAGITPGVHTLQANGLAPDGAERSLNIGVLVKPTVVALRPATASARVLFAPMSPQLGAQEKSTLQALVKRTGKQGVRVVSIGYVQPTTATANDQALSTQRARNVVAYLRMLGLKGEFVVRGDGVATQQGAAARRVNVTVTYRR